MKFNFNKLWTSKTSVKRGFNASQSCRISNNEKSMLLNNTLSHTVSCKLLEPLCFFVWSFQARKSYFIKVRLFLNWITVIFCTSAVILPILHWFCNLFIKWLSGLYEFVIAFWQVFQVYRILTPRLLYVGKN